MLTFEPGSLKIVDSGGSPPKRVRSRPDFVPGLYFHGKTGEYYLADWVEMHSETGVLMVSYQALYGDREHFTRPLSMWNQEVGGQPRFKLVRRVVRHPLSVDDLLRDLKR